jgi:protein-tyrosine phosphatase
MTRDENACFLDAHTHILPGIDDGAEDEAESQKMLARLAGEGVTTMALTPHYFHYKEPLADFLARREAALELIQPMADDAGVSLLVASETYLTEDLLNEPDLSGLCFQSTRLLLTEISMNCLFSDRDISLFDRIAVNYGVTPILAHIERYPRLLNSEGLLSELMEIGCFMQVNLSSFTEGGGSIRKRLLRLMADGYISFIGTDCHRMAFRPPEYKKHMGLIIKKLGADFMARFQQNMARMLVPATLPQRIGL